MNVNKGHLFFFFFFLFFVLLDVLLYDYLINNPDYYQLGSYSNETEEFRAMRFGGNGLYQLKELAKSNGDDDYAIIAAAMIDARYDLADTKFNNLSYLNYTAVQKDVRKKKPVDFQKLANSYQKVLADIQYFPIPESTDLATPKITYEDSWGFERSYGGERRHEGTDLMAGVNTRGLYPVVSITDGVVEKIGWLEQGGWRIGIRAESGAYFYYAHLFNYARPFEPGDEILAGELLGFMGDSGYSKIEGTVGNFDVHLHLGIYLETDNYEELSVNPYWILRYLENNKLKYSY